MAGTPRSAAGRCEHPDGRAAHAVDRLTSWIGEWPFAAFLLFAIVFSELALGALMLWPADAGAFGAFADEFRKWCLGQDGATGTLQWAYVAMYILNPLAVGGIVWIVWSGPLRAAFRQGPRAFAAPALLALVLVFGSTAALWAWQEPAPAVEALAFPAEEIRTATPAPDFALIDQEGRPFHLADWKGRPILVTAVYSSCGTACPRILAGLRGVVDRVASSPGSSGRSEGTGFTVAVLTLDPARDTPARLATLANAYGIRGADRKFLSGVPADVESALDAFGFARRRIPETGVIDHAPLYVLVDRSGRIAYRFTTGETQERWMTEAVQLLERE